MASARFSLPRRGVYASALAPQLALADLLAGQFFPRYFRRYDLLVRARVVRAWLFDEADRDAAEHSYQLMQQLRGATVSLPRFHALVEGVRSSGLDPAFPVGVSPRGPLLDGAHRVAVALATGAKTIAVDVRGSLIPPDYSRAWLAEAGMPEEDLLAADLLLDKFLADTGHDVLVVASGARVDELREMCQPGAKVIATREATLDSETVAALEAAITPLPWPDHRKREVAPAPRLHPGPTALVRLRVPRPQWYRLPGTHARVSRLVEGYLETGDRLGIAGVAGLTWFHNANGFAVLDRAGLRMWGSVGEH